MSSPVISLTNVYHSYNRGTPIEKAVLKDITLEVKEGETLGIIGKPGSGKTTLAKTMASLITPSSGTLRSPGMGPGKTGLLFQFPEHQLFCDTVFNDITYSMRELANVNESEIELIYKDACIKAGLDPDSFRNCRESEVSSGEKRRVAIASVLAMNPSILILDEPAAGLDNIGKAAILKELKKLSGDGLTLVVVSHEIEDLTDIVERLVFIDEGRIQCDGAVTDVLLKIAEDDNATSLLPYVTEIMIRLEKRGFPVKRDIYDANMVIREIKRVFEDI